MTSGLRKIVFFLLLLAITYIAYRYMIRPANERLAVQRARVQAKLAKLNKFEKVTAAAEDVSKQLEELQEAIKSLENKLPPKDEIDKVLGQVTVIAQRQGLRDKAIRSLKKKGNSGYIEQPLKMELVGDFSSFYSFLLELEKLPRIMKVRELKLSKEDEGLITAECIVGVFFQDKGSAM